MTKKTPTTSSRTRRTAAHYALAVAAVAVATLARQTIDPALGDHLPFAFYFVAIILVAWFTRLGPSVLALMLGAWAANYFFTQPRYVWKFHLGGAADTIGFMLYAFVGITAIVACEALHRAQRRAADLAERLRIKLASIGDGVIATDTQGRITSMNPAAESLTGWTTAEAKGRTLDEVFHIVSESTRQTVENPVTKALKEGVVVGLANHTILIAKDGTERFIDDSAAPIRSKDGEIVGGVLIFRDISERRQADKVLETQKRLYESVTENASVSLFIMDDKQQCVFMNSAAEAITGYTWEETRGRALHDVVHHTRPDGSPYPLSECPIDQAFPKQNKMQGREVFVHKDGHFFDVAFTASPLRDERGTPVGTIIEVRDITESKRAEKALRQNAALFATIIEQAPGGVYVMDAQLRVREVNAEALPIFANVQPLIGRELREVLETLWGPEIGRQCTDIVRHTLETGERYVSPRFDHRRQDTREEQVYEWETQRIELPDGQHGVVCYFKDVTKRERAAAALRASQERMRLAAETTGVGIWEWNVLTNAIRWDALMFQMYGIEPTPDGLVNYRDWSGAVLPEDLAENEAILQDTIRRCGRSTRGFRIRRRSDGECRWIQAVETVRANHDGKAEWAVGTNLDVTDRKQMEQALRQADRRKDEFLATLGHELRNPLAPVRAAVHFLRVKGPPDPDLQWAGDVIDRQTRAMARLIDDLMDVSRINEGKVQLRREHVELAKIVQGAIETSRPLVKEMGHELTVTLPFGQVIVDADLTRLAQVFLNLLNNAAKYTERGGRIDLCAQVQGSDVVVSVKDTGIGIPAEKLPSIFEMFSQVEGALSRSQGGLGIGLSLVKRLVELHGGSVEARSGGPGKGSEFLVRLPIVVKQTYARPASDDGDKAAPTSDLRILVVDDNKDAADGLAMLLEVMGNTVHTAHDGEEAVAAAREFRPHVVLCDIGLPKLNGYEACRRMKAEAWDEKMILIAVTGWGQDDDKRKAQEAGFDHHIVKPLDPQALMNMLAGLNTAKA